MNCSIVNITTTASWLTALEPIILDAPGVHFQPEEHILRFFVPNTAENPSVELANQHLGSLCICGFDVLTDEEEKCDMLVAVFDEDHDRAKFDKYWEVFSHGQPLPDGHRFLPQMILGWFEPGTAPQVIPDICKRLEEGSF